MNFSRKQFLQFSGLTLAGFLTLPLNLSHSSTNKRFVQDLQDALIATAKSELLAASGFQEWLPQIMGRIIDSYVGIHISPDFQSEVLKLVWKDSIVQLNGVVYNVDTDSHNKIWYQVENGYVHSGSIQPVNTILNEPSAEIPSTGQLAEVTVPYTDAHWAVGRNQPIAYRMYYQTTHWVVEQQIDDQGEAWYALVEDKWDLNYFVPARHLRLIPDVELSTLSPNVPNTVKKLVVYLNQQVLIAYENNNPVFAARVATGGKFRDGDFSTQTGYYITFHKRPSRHMAAGNLAAGGYDLPGVPWISYFTESGVSFHGTYWHNNFGRPRSHGCINLSPMAAKWVYRWTLPNVPTDAQMIYGEIGTSIQIVDE